MVNRKMSVERETGWNGEDAGEAFRRRKMVVVMRATTRINSRHKRGASIDHVHRVIAACPEQKVSGAGSAEIADAHRTRLAGTLDEDSSACARRRRRHDMAHADHTRDPWSALFPPADLTQR